MTAKSDAPDRTSLVEMAMGFARGKILCAAVRLGIADALGDGEKDLEALAAATASNSDSLHRLLRALAGIGVVREVAPGHFVLTALGKPLRKDAPDSVWASIVFWADLLADSWTYLPECVRAGSRSGAAEAMEREGVRSRWSRAADAQAIFHAVFSESSAHEMAPYLAAYDFSWCSVVADLGGAGGALLMAILNAYPTARGILVDRQEAVDRAVPAFEAAGLSARCQLVAGDLLAAVPRGADAYVMKCVLHGYDDDKARCILQRCRAAMTPQNRLLIIESVLPERIDASDPHVEKVLMSDINMLAVTGGRERNSTQWGALLSSAGFGLLRVVPVADSMAIIEAAPRSASVQ